MGIFNKNKQTAPSPPDDVPEPPMEQTNVIKVSFPINTLSTGIGGTLTGTSSGLGWQQWQGTTYTATFPPQPIPTNPYYPPANFFAEEDIRKAAYVVIARSVGIIGLCNSYDEAVELRDKYAAQTGKRPLIMIPT